MTQYRDRHGTEVRPGDTYWSNIAGTEHPALAVFFGGPNVFGNDVVVRRADGSPVYRYRGGEDVRGGDEYINPTMGQMRVMCPEISDGGETKWAQCTLLRRATPPVDERPVLGKDRLGRDVRKGSRIADAETGFTMTAELLEDDEFVGRNDEGCRGWIERRNAELADENMRATVIGRDRNGRDVRVGSSVLIHPHLRGAVVIECGVNAKVRAGTCEAEFVAYRDLEVIHGAGVAEKAESDVVVDGTTGGMSTGNPPTILESLARALSQPTRASRIAANYAKFHAAVTAELAREPSFAVVTDRSETNLVAWITAPLGVKLTCLSPADKTLDFDAIAFEWVAAVRRMVDEEAGKRARAR